eukprot:jgi/Hompol1/1547/HPOL_002737-RA
MAPRVCRSCGPTTAEIDEKLGHVVCIHCGQVLEENTIVSEVTFSETAKGSAIADGFQLSAHQARAHQRPGSFGLIRTGGQESREQTILNGHRRIQEVANQPQIRMAERQVQFAQRFFNVAVNHNFTKGRKSGCVVAACLYIVCRMETTAHMLIDFADALSTNVFQIGATFVALCKVAGVQKLPHIDPALLISRFATKLEFGQYHGRVVTDATRIVARMTRDWMHYGRRPAGICAAALFIAARLHGFNLTLREIIMHVKICKTTLRTRLQEFQNTPSASLSVSQFQTIDLTQDQDPPSFKRSLARTVDSTNLLKTHPAAVSLSTSLNTSTHLDKNKAPEHSSLDSYTNPAAGTSIANTTTIVQASTSTLDTAGSTSSHLPEQSRAPENHDDPDQLDPDFDIDISNIEEDTENLLRTDPTFVKALQKLDQGDTVADDDETLDDLDDDIEVQNMLDVGEDEVEFKKMIWEEENGDWEIKQAAKRAHELVHGVPDKRRNKKRQRANTSRFEASTAAEAARNLVMAKPTLSKKINYNVLETLFETNIE